MPALIPLLLLALLARGLVPAGFMPASHVGPGVQLALCTADGLVSRAPPLGAGFHDGADRGTGAPDAPAPHDDGSAHEASCVYAASAVVAPPPAALATQFADAPARPPTPVALSTDVRPTIVRSQSPRAPPVRA